MRKPSLGVGHCTYSQVLYDVYNSGNIWYIKLKGYRVWGFMVVESHHMNRSKG
jgi:hypothetical protein